MKLTARIKRKRYKPNRCYLPLRFFYWIYDGETQCGAEIKIPITATEQAELATGYIGHIDSFNFYTTPGD